MFWGKNCAPGFGEGPYEPLDGTGRTEVFSADRAEAEGGLLESTCVTT